MILQSKERNNNVEQETGGRQENSNVVSAPSISLPKGGGAIRGIGEKFAANPVTGTGAMTVPIATSPGRSDFGPQLSLSYDSGAGNGPFGLGWNLSRPSITRKTDKGLPKYQDADESDVFILSGAEDLVPEFEKDEQGNWILKDGKPVIHDKPRTILGVTYRVRRYRPRIEGLFARIERWTNNTQTNEVHWRSISRDNITTVYGRTRDSRIEDPSAPKNSPRVFSWLICESYDDKGNAIYYDYEPEDSIGIDLSQINERNRTDDSRSPNRYLKRIKYGNKTPVEINPELPREFSENLSERNDWLFEVVFDYEGGHYESLPIAQDGRQLVNAQINPTPVWNTRSDPFSNHRAGFEVRTYRLCHRVLMFHHFSNELDVEDYLVRSTEFNYKQGPISSFITGVTQAGFKRQDNGAYLKKSMPPLEFEYSQAKIQDKVQEVDQDSLENLPQGLDGGQYQWVDIDGEGITGILTEQGNSWLYKRNISPLPVIGEQGQSQIAARFAPQEQLPTIPSLANLSGGRQQFLDLAGDGQLDVVELDSPTPGFYERGNEQDWQSFKPFKTIPNIAWQDPNLRFIDLTGDGHADIMISEDQAFSWYPSLAEKGFAAGEKVRQALDEENGPRIVFSDGTQSIHLADISGDGLTDLVRIRNGEVCYWPNLGYGRFGAKVTMDNSPHFDAPDQFDQGRIRLADIDGSGVTDILYLKNDSIYIYLNESGNRWADVVKLNAFPSIDNLSSVVAVDLFGNGTACLVWSSPLPGDAHAPMRYIKLMAAGKPHLLIRTKNNLGAETHIQYAPSTYFYLKDKQAGKPWITKLPFPVHVVEKVTVTDKWNKTAFSSTYSYHHGYFDGHEREFRGFGRVEQIDAESYGEFAQGNVKSPYITDDQTLYQPPIKTVTWYHTGAMIDRDKILSQFKHEYFPHWLEDNNPVETNILGVFQEAELPESDIKQQNLDAEEFREALRACTGLVLREEVYELDVDALTQGKHQPVKLFSTAYHNCHIQRLQARAMNPHAVFLVTESEAITYQYELDLKTDTLTPDPRIAHTLNLNIDEFGNVLQAVAVVYPRIGKHQDDTLEPQAMQLIHDVQLETHIAYTETHFTNDINTSVAPDSYRLRAPCEALNYELTGISPESDYFTLDELHRFWLNLDYQTTGLVVPIIDYHQIPKHIIRQKRLVEHSKILYFNDADRTAPEFLLEPLPFGEQGILGLPYETYTLALTDDLLDAILAEKLTPEIRTELNDAANSGYLSGAELAARFNSTETAGQYWIRSGIAGFSNDAADHFFLPERYTDAFNQTTTLNFDPLDLYIRSSTDPVGNTVSVEIFDFRVLAPRQLKDINDNLSEVVFDVLGLPTATAVKGKGEQADNLSGFTDELLNPDRQTKLNFFIQPRAATETLADDQQRQQTEAQRLLGNATARHLYYFGEIEETLADGSTVIHWGEHPASACGIIREQHVAQLGEAESSPLQLGFEYSDGGGNVLVTKVQAEPENSSGPLRWIANGKTILNNKGNPVKQYEPYFCTDENGEPDHRFEEPREQGVTPITYYDAADRVVRTELPDGSYNRVEFSPWHVTSYDPNDTAFNADPTQQSDWYQRRTDPAHPQFAGFNAAEHQRAASLSKDHADTPTTVLIDSLGREVISIAHNRVKDVTDTLQDEKYLTFTKLDAEGKPLWIRDARGNLVMQYITPIKPTRSVDEPDPLDPEKVPAKTVPAYDIAGNLLFQHSMDGGDRWLIYDAVGQPFYAWDANERAQDDGSLVLEERIYHTLYDELRRPLEQRLKVDGTDWQVIERFVYGETLSGAQERNLRGQVYRLYDGSGLIGNQSFDFKGNLLQTQRQMNSAYDAPLIHWPENPPPDALDEEVYTQNTQYDALNRMVRQENWHLSGRTPAIYIPEYNQRSLLAGETLSVQGETSEAISNIEYDAKGQRTRIQYGNGTDTRYHYDPQTFRLLQLRTTRNGFDPEFPGFHSAGSNDNVLQQLSYTYDPVGNITEIYDEAHEPVFFKNQRVEPRNRYVYDALYRLIEATGRENDQARSAPGQKESQPFEVNFPVTDKALRNYTQRYSYDGVGNILQMGHEAGQGSWTRHYEYASDSNRLLRTWTGSNDTNAIAYDYDSHGSMLNLNKTPDEYRLRWDTNDMIHHIDLGGGGQVYYNYDAGKQRSYKRIERNGSTVEERLYLGGMERYRRWTGSDLVEEIETHHLYADEQRVLIVEDVLSTDNDDLDVGVLYRYQYGNHLGSVGLELDAVGAVISYEEYHPYGTTAYRAVNAGVKAVAKRYRYTGMERDEESGLSYHGARFYMAWLGRWCGVDPIGIEDGVNVFNFVKNRPTNYFDDSGLQAKPSTIEQYSSHYYQPLSYDEFKRTNYADPNYVGTGELVLLEGVTEQEIKEGYLQYIANYDYNFIEDYKIYVGAFEAKIKEEQVRAREEAWSKTGYGGGPPAPSQGGAPAHYDPASVSLAATGPLGLLATTVTLAEELGIPLELAAVLGETETAGKVAWILENTAGVTASSEASVVTTVATETRASSALSRIGKLGVYFTLIFFVESDACSTCYNLPVVTKAVNSNLPHASDRAVERGVFSNKAAASQELKELSKNISKNGFPRGTIRDPAHYDRVLVPVGKRGMAAYQVAKNGTAKLKTVLIAK